MERIRLAARPQPAILTASSVASSRSSAPTYALSLEQAPAEPTQRPGFMMAGEPFDQSFQAPGAPLEGRGIDDPIGIQQNRAPGSSSTTTSAGEPRVPGASA